MRIANTHYSYFIINKHTILKKIDINSIGIDGRSGAGQMDICRKTFLSKQKLLTTKVIFLYDPETLITNSDDGKIITTKMCRGILRMSVCLL